MCFRPPAPRSMRRSVAGGVAESALHNKQIWPIRGCPGALAVSWRHGGASSHQGANACGRIRRQTYAPHKASRSRLRLRRSGNAAGHRAHRQPHEPPRRRLFGIGQRRHTIDHQAGKPAGDGQIVACRQRCLAQGGEAGTGHIARHLFEADLRPATRMISAVTGAAPARRRNPSSSAWLAASSAGTYQAGRLASTLARQSLPAAISDMSHCVFSSSMKGRNLSR